MDLLTVVLATISAGLGLVIGWLLPRPSGGAIAVIEAERNRLTEELRQARLDRDRAMERSVQAELDAASAASRLDAERESFEAQRLQRRADYQALANQFEAIAGQALENNTERFLQVAQERLARTSQEHAATLEQREQSIVAVLRPMEQALGAVRTEVLAAEQARVGAQAALGQELHTMRESTRNLGTEAARLTTALRAPQVRGRWGETRLRRIVEVAGMVEHVDFSEQVQVNTDDGALRPDMVVWLSDGKSIVVDSKVSLIGYLEAVESVDEAVRAARFKAHARHLRQHIDSLASKSYWEHFEPTPQFVVMFIPAETFLDAALEVDGGLLEYAFERDVVIATPNTTMALLRTVAYTWRQESLTENAQEILRVGRELYSRLGTLGGHLGKLGRQLDSAVGSYNQTVSSLESRVFVSARRLGALQISTEDLSPVEQVVQGSRRLSAPEFYSAVSGEPGVECDEPGVEHGEPGVERNEPGVEYGEPGTEYEEATTQN